MGVKSWMLGGVLVALAVLPTAALAGLSGRLLVDGVEGGAMEPGEPSRWTIGFTDAATGAAVTDFQLEHQKPMHLIVVSADLQSFAHIHPAYAPSTGVFTADVNAASVDPDNQDLVRTITRPGVHFAFGEVRPAGGDLEQHRFEIRANGTPQTIDLTPETIDAQGWITHHVDASGQPAQPGSELRVRLKPEGIKADMVHLTFRVERRKGSGYAAVDDLEPWLGMDAHAVMIGATGPTASDRVFRHLHAGHHDDHGKGTGAHILFMLHGDDVPPSGVYRTWLQVKRQGRVLTFPFTIAL
jgi:hypothetical protein